MGCLSRSKQLPITAGIFRNIRCLNKHFLLNAFFFLTERPSASLLRGGCGMQMLVFHHNLALAHMSDLLTHMHVAQCVCARVYEDFAMIKAVPRHCVWHRYQYCYYYFYIKAWMPSMETLFPFQTESIGLSAWGKNTWSYIHFLPYCASHSSVFLSEKVNRWIVMSMKVLVDPFLASLIYWAMVSLKNHLPFKSCPLFL